MGTTHSKRTKPPEYFKEINSFDERKKASASAIHRCPNSIPIICEPDPDCSFTISKVKYEVPNDITIGQLAGVVRKYINGLNEDQPLGLWIDNCNHYPDKAWNVSDMYENHKDEDGFLYIKLRKMVYFS